MPTVPFPPTARLNAAHAGKCSRSLACAYACTAQTTASTAPATPSANPPCCMRITIPAPASLPAPSASSASRQTPASTSAAAAAGSPARQSGTQQSLPSNLCRVSPRKNLRHRSLPLTPQTLADAPSQTPSPLISPRKRQQPRILVLPPQKRQPHRSPRPASHLRVAILLRRRRPRRILPPQPVRHNHRRMPGQIRRRQLHPARSASQSRPPPQTAPPSAAIASVRARFACI